MPSLEDGSSQFHTYPQIAAGAWCPSGLSLSKQLLNKLKLHQHQLNITAPKPQLGHQQVTAGAQTDTNTYKIHLIPTGCFTLRKYHLVTTVITLTVHLQDC